MGGIRRYDTVHYGYDEEKFVGGVREKIRIGLDNDLR